MLEKDPVMVEIHPETMRPHPANMIIGVNREGFAVCHHGSWGWGGASLHGYFLYPPLATTHHFKSTEEARAQVPRTMMARMGTSPPDHSSGSSFLAPFSLNLDSLKSDRPRRQIVS